MIWWLIWLVALIVIGYGLKRWSAHADEIEDDSAYVYKNRTTRQGYGTKFLNALTGRGNERD